MKGRVVWLYVISVESGWLHKVLRLSQGLLELPRTEGKLHCLIVSENLVYGTMNRNFPII